MRSKDSIFYVLCYQTPKPQEPLFSIYHAPPFHAPLQQGAQHTHVTLVLPALEEISLILQILTDSDNQTNTCQCQVTLTWNVLFLMESKGSKSETWIEAPDRSLSTFLYPYCLTEDRYHSQMWSWDRHAQGKWHSRGTYLLYGCKHHYHFHSVLSVLV